MKALILNSGMGRRMGDLTTTHPKCMTGLVGGETILSRQLRQLETCGFRDIVITTGPFTKVLEPHALGAVKEAHVTFVNNPDYASTNYIYSIYLAKELLRDDLLLLHGDLVFLDNVLEELLRQPGSAMTVSSSLPLPDKDFKAVVESGLVRAVGVEFFENAMAAQPLYKLAEKDWLVWLTEIEDFIVRGETGCYAENALNCVSERCPIHAFDVRDRLCAEIDMPGDLAKINAILLGEGEVK